MSILKQLHNNLKAKGKVTTFSGDELSQIENEINKRCRDFRMEYKKKAHQSEIETGKIVLNA